MTIVDKLVDGEGFLTLWPPVEGQHTGRRADEYLADRYRFYSRHAWQKRLSEGLVHLNGARLKPSRRIHRGDVFSLFHTTAREPLPPDRVRVLYQEAGVAALSKPGGIPTHQNGAFRTNHFTALMQAELGPEWHTVHRLDADTSGVLLCGSSPEVRRELSRQIEEHGVDKRYVAIVHGIPQTHEWTVDAPIGDPSGSAIRIKKWVVADGAPSRTDFRVLARAAAHTLVEARPRTGRTNQIRVHAAYCGHPLVGDKLYHPDENVFLEYFAEGNTPKVIAKAGFWRACLHATSLTFIHPSPARKVTVDAPMPEDMQQLWRDFES